MSSHQSDAAPSRSGAKANGRQRANGAADSATVTAAQVCDYLQEHPQFLEKHPSLLEVLAAPSRYREDGIVDFQQVMVERLRHEIGEIATARDDLVITGRSNLAAQSRVHQAVIALLRARSFEQLVEFVITDLAVILDLDVVTLGVESSNFELPPVRLGGLCQLEPNTVDSLIGPGRFLVLRPDTPGDPAIFGAGAGLVASDALIRMSISRKTPPAMLALGSRQVEQFHPGQGTELLSFLGQSLESCIRGWLNLPD